MLSYHAYLVAKVHRKVDIVKNVKLDVITYRAMIADIGDLLIEIQQNKHSKIVDLYNPTIRDNYLQSRK